MQARHFPPASDCRSALRQAILQRVPGVSSNQLDQICASVNPRRRYFIKSTDNPQRFLNLVTRETIVTENIRTFSEVLPLYGQFQSPYFEKIGTTRTSRAGELNPSISAAAVKIRAGVDHKRCTTTYSLILYLAEQNTICTAF